MQISQIVCATKSTKCRGEKIETKLEKRAWNAWYCGWENNKLYIFIIYNKYFNFNFTQLFRTESPL